MKIVLVGGSGGMGQLYAEIFRKAGMNVTSIGRNTLSSQRKRALSHADVVWVSVSLASTEKILKEIRTQIPCDCLLVEIASVKSGVFPIISSSKCKEAVSLHPLHGPQENLKGQIILEIPARKGKKYALLKKALQKQGAKFVSCTLKEHEDAMAVIQAATHALLLAHARVSSSLLSKKQRVWKTPAFGLLTDLEKKLLSQDASLYACIQKKNKQAKKARDALKRELALVLSSANNEKKFSRLWNR